jgi:hypothetical protein
VEFVAAEYNIDFAISWPEMVAAPRPVRRREAEFSGLLYSSSSIMMTSRLRILRVFALDGLFPNASIASAGWWKYSHRERLTWELETQNFDADDMDVYWRNSSNDGNQNASPGAYYWSRCCMHRQSHFRKKQLMKHVVLLLDSSIYWIASEILTDRKPRFSVMNHVDEIDNTRFSELSKIRN